jgi:hypothetical protein
MNKSLVIFIYRMFLYFDRPVDQHRSVIPVAVKQMDNTQVIVSPPVVRMHIDDCPIYCYLSVSIAYFGSSAQLVVQRYTGRFYFYQAYGDDFGHSLPFRMKRDNAPA